MTSTAMKAHTDGLYLMLLGAAAFVAMSFLLILAGNAPLHDFRTSYYGGACLLAHCDPYLESDIERLYSKEVPPPTVPDRNRIVVTKNIYLPSTFPFTVPLALLPEKVGLDLWVALIGVSFLVASFLIWRVASASAPTMAGLLVCFCLANSGSLVYFTNPAGFVVPFCILAALSFIYERFVFAGIVLLAVSLAFKPHDGGLVWLYFVLAGGTYRRRALQTLALVAGLSLPALLWVSHVSPHWLAELSANLGAFSGKGNMNDPRGPHGACMMTNLQTVTSFFLDNAAAYNAISYLVCAPLLLAWCWLTVRARRTRVHAWLALASISALSVLPIYHRQYDAKLILLSVPALALVWSRRDRMAWAALAVSGVAFFFDGDFPWVAILQLTQKLHLYPNGPYSPAMVALLDFPVPLSLLALAAFYLWIYWRSARGEGPVEEPEPALEACKDGAVARI
jgi:hypothetical protein